MVVEFSRAAMDQLVTDFGAYLRLERMRSPGTTRRYLAVMTEFTDFLAEQPGTAHLPLEKVAKPQLATFLRQGRRENGEPSASLWNLRLAALRSFYDYLFKGELVTVNPAEQVDRVKYEAEERVPISLDDYLALVEAMERSSTLYRSRNVAIIQVLFHSLLRVSEFVSLNTAQVDFERYEFLNVRRKGGKFLASPFNDLVAEALERYLKDRPRFKAPESEPALFLSDRGTRLSIRMVEELVKTCAKRAGLSRAVFPHLLRHSGATELAEMGTPMPAVQGLLGHKHLTTTERYIHRKSTARHRAVAELGERVAKRLLELKNGPTREP